MEVRLEKGIFLVASPRLRDPNFRQTVVLLCEHGLEGALGVVVNRPTAMHLSEVLPQVPVLEGQCHRLFSGGPVQPMAILLLYRLAGKPDDEHHVFDGVYMGGDVAVVERVLTAPAGGEAIRAYMGYSGWGPGQLENEMKTGSWLTLPADSSVVFEKDPTRVWPDILRTFGEPYNVYADMPLDPTLN